MPISPALAITGSYRIQTAKISFCANALICDARSRKTPSASSSILASASVKSGSSTLFQVLLGVYLPACADVGNAAAHDPLTWCLAAAAGWTANRRLRGRPSQSTHRHRRVSRGRAEVSVGVRRGGAHGWPFKIHMMYWAAATAVMANAREKASCLRAVMPRTVAGQAG